MLEALGYETETKVLSVPVTYTSMAEGDIDVFLGNWMPTMEADIAPYREAGTVDTVRTNLEGAKYTLATNAKGRRAGHQGLRRHRRSRKTRWTARSTGSRPGNDGNRLIIDMIAADAFGLDGFEVVESSEQGMLAQVARADERGEPVIFLGWEPHPMNAQLQDELSDRRRRLLRPEPRRGDRLHQHPRGLCRRMPERGQAAAEPVLHAWRWRTRSWARS